MIQLGVKFYTMNRAERRKKLTAEDLEAAYYSGVKYATSGLCAAFVMIMHDKFGFGTSRLMKVLNEVSDKFDSVQRGYMSIDDLRQTIKEEFNIEIR